MPYFDRFDICEAYLALEMDWNVSGVLQERPSCRRRGESCSVQLSRLDFRPGPSWRGYDSLSENGKEIYDAFVARHGLCDCGACRGCEAFWESVACEGPVKERTCLEQDPRLPPEDYCERCEMLFWVRGRRNT